mgnify:CR=1 FL=1
MGLTQAYLVLYNAACLGGWALALAQGALALAGTDGDAAAKLGSVWPAAGQTGVRQVGQVSDRFSRAQCASHGRRQST